MMLWPFGQVCLTMLRLGMRTSLIFNPQHVATGWPNARIMLRLTMLRYVTLKYCDRLAGACKCWASNVGVCCVDMLRSFGQGLRVLKKNSNMTMYTSNNSITLPWEQAITASNRAGTSIMPITLLV